MKRAEKMQRERIRHYKLIRDLLLDKLDTSQMRVLEIGGGPEPVSDLLRHKFRLVVDPCTEEYRRYFPCPDHLNEKGESFYSEEHSEFFELAIATNSLDHVEDWTQVVSCVDHALVPGGYFAVLCAENNAITNPHPAHVINLTAADIHRMLDQGYETVWELNYAEHGYRYGWASYEGRVGQPAFALLMRKAYGYDS